MSKKNSKTKRKHRKDRKQWHGKTPVIDFNLDNFDPADHELASDAQVKLLVKIGVNDLRATTMRKQDASREIDRRKKVAEKARAESTNNSKLIRKRKRLFNQDNQQ